MKNLQKMSSKHRFGNAVCRCFTMIELVVTLSVIGVFLAIMTRSLLKTKHNIEHSEGKIMLSTGDLLNSPDMNFANMSVAESEGSDYADTMQQSQASAEVLAGEIGDESDVGEEAVSGKKRHSMPGAVAPSHQKRSRDGRSSALSNKKESYANYASKKKRKAVVSKEEPENLLPPPVPIKPKTVKITVLGRKNLEVEPFARFFFLTGSDAPLDSYHAWFGKMLNQKGSLTAGLEKKRQNGIRISRYSHYVRREAVLKSSPYRCYMLRRRILFSLVKPFDEKEPVGRLKEKAKKQLKPCAIGEEITFDLDEQTFTGTFNGVEDGLFVIGSKRFSLQDLPESVRWRFDKALLEEERNYFVETELKREKEAYLKAQSEQIEAILRAEFPMLKNDPLISQME